MWDRFSERGRRAMGRARQEAGRLKHDYVGTEHILLGLLAEESGVAVSVLENLDVDPTRVRAALDRAVRPGGASAPTGELPFTPHAKRVLELSLEEAAGLGHAPLVGAEHLLLGLMRERDGIAARVLRGLGVRLEDVREEVLELPGAEPGGTPARPSRSSGPDRESWETLRRALEDARREMQAAAEAGNAARLKELRPWTWTLLSELRSKFLPDFAPLEALAACVRDDPEGLERVLADVGVSAADFLAAIEKEVRRREEEAEGREGPEERPNG